jgi:hypothetical protein
MAEKTAGAGVLCEERQLPAAQEQYHTFSMNDFRCRKESEQKHQPGLVVL